MKPWIKLHGATLTDPKMGMLNDRLWRRFVELILVASQKVPIDDGRLPPPREIAWTLHVTPEQIETEMIELAAIGLLSQVEGVWIVTNYMRWQEPDNAADRQRFYRKRKAKIDEWEARNNPQAVSRLSKVDEESNESVTKRNRDVTKRNESVTKLNQNQNIESESESESEQQHHDRARENDRNVLDDADVDAKKYDVEIDELENDLEQIGFTAPGLWISSLEVERWELIRLWLGYLGVMEEEAKKQIRSIPGFLRAQVNEGKSPPVVKEKVVRGLGLTMEEIDQMIKR